MMEESRIKDIRVHLESKGYEVHFPGQKLGQCKKPYIVVRDDGMSQFQQYSSHRKLYAVMVYVPLDRYGDIEPLADRVEQDMKGLRPMIASTNFRTPSFPDDTVKAHMVSLQYCNIKKIADCESI